MKLPLYISVPHAGTRVPPEAEDLCLLSREDLLADCDEGADFIYFPLQEHAAGFSTTDIARSVVDLNRAPGELGGNGAVKEHTCRNVPVFRTFPDQALVGTLLARYHAPYHQKLSAAAAGGRIKLGIDCHTMSVVGPPVSPDPGRKRPLICLSNGGGACPEAWLVSLARIFSALFKEEAAINTPFRGGYITQSHAAEMAWLQLEISQTDAFSQEFKRDCILEGLQSFCHAVLVN